MCSESKKIMNRTVNGRSEHTYVDGTGSSLYSEPWRCLQAQLHAPASKVGLSFVRRRGLLSHGRTYAAFTVRTIFYRHPSAILAACLRDT